MSVPIGPPPVTSTRSPGRTCAAGDPVQRDRERLGERGVAQRETVGQAQQLARGDLDVVGERALEVAALARPGRGPTHRLGRPVAAVLALAALAPTVRRRRGSPTFQPVTLAPTAATVPLYSWPPIEFGRPQPSSTKWRSEPQTPQWLTSSRTSSGPRSGTGYLDLDPPITCRPPPASSRTFPPCRERCPNLTRRQLPKPIWRRSPGVCRRQNAWALPGVRVRGERIVIT